MRFAAARDVVFVVGMGRSGSSALARLLSLCGGVLPRRLLPANYGNPAGYWEPQEALEFNDRFLSAHGSSWYDPGLALQLDPPGLADRRRFVEELTGFLAGGFGDDGPLIVKEPRISALLPYWIAAATRLGFAPKFVHLVRAPDEVASSLAARDDLSVAHSYALWLKYNLLAERHARGAPRTFIMYEEMMRDWEAVLARCIRDARVGLAITEKTRRQVRAFLAPRQRARSEATRATGVVDPCSAELAGRAHRAFGAAAAGMVDAFLFDEIWNAYVAHSATIRV
ncbi:MAG: hypothetical protein JO036_20465 [Candidatus Eremiobacteraeota bacterium]|nr:hypothetical protein [Candidatus Eremiobacteraeota bacterium]